MTFEPFHISHERIFGKKTFRQMASFDDGINRHQRRLIEGKGVVRITNPSRKPKATKTGKRRKVKKTLCPHCATVNLVRKSSYETVCRKCGYEGL